MDQQADGRRVYGGGGHHVLNNDQKEISGKRFKKIKAKFYKMMVNSEKKINVKVLQSVQGKHLAVEE